MSAGGEMEVTSVHSTIAFPHGGGRRVSTHTVNEMLDKYEREGVPKLAARSQRDYRRLLGHLRAHFGSKDVRSVTRQDIIDFATVSKGPVQRLRMIAIFRVAFMQAMKWGWVDGDPYINMERSAPRRRDPPLSLEEFNVQ